MCFGTVKIYFHMFIARCIFIYRKYMLYHHYYVIVIVIVIVCASSANEI